MSEMPTSDELIENLRSAMKERDDLKQAVLDWMDAEAKHLRLRSCGQAPMWAEYEKAEDAVRARASDIAPKAS